MTLAKKSGGVAQLWLERPVDIREVVGSSPIVPTIFKGRFRSFFYCPAVAEFISNKLRHVNRYTERIRICCEIFGVNKIFLKDPRRVLSKKLIQRYVCLIP